MAAVARTSRRQALGYAFGDRPRSRQIQIRTTTLKHRLALQNLRLSVFDASFSMRTVLFLCTGNYYRSRFAEEVFNHYARRDGLKWIARSRALAIERGANNVGPLSPFAMQGLRERSLVAHGANRLPQQCTTTDLEAADRIVALKESEHRPLIVERFPGWEHCMEYWQVDDVDMAHPHIARAVSRERSRRC
jgi:protein-tyrosine phosphatase